MFKRLARFRHFEPHRLQAAHSNDNQPGRRRSAGQRLSPQPALACHWSLVDETRLECRWQVECFDRGQPRSAWTRKESDGRRT